MRWFLLFVLLIGIALSAGCTTVNTTPPAVMSIPNLVGNWTGPMRGYDETVGYTEFSGANLTMVVIEQNDRFFSGQMSYPSKNGTLKNEEFAGVFHRDGKIFRIVEYNGGYDEGLVISEDEIEMIYMEDNDPSGIEIDSLKRS